MESGKDQLLHQKIANEIGISVVKIRRLDNDELGFTLGFNEENGTYVKEIKEGTKLQEDGLLKTGDRLVWVNRTNVEEMSLEEVLEVLEKAPDGSNVVTARNKQQQQNKPEQDEKREQPKEVQLIPNLLQSEEPYMFGVTYLA